MAAEKKTAKKTKRPPRQVWITIAKDIGATCAYSTKAEAMAECWEDETVSGPYILAERVGNE